MASSTLSIIPMPLIFVRGEREVRVGDLDQVIHPDSQGDDEADESHEADR